MGMQIEKSFVVQAPASAVWDFLTDPLQGGPLPAGRRHHRQGMKSRIVERAPGETEVTVVSEVNVVGMLAQFGRGMIQDVSDQLFQKFTEAMRRELETPAAAAPPAAAPPAVSEMSTVTPAASAGAVADLPIPPAAPPPVAGEAALDIGSLGAAAAGRAASRVVQRPGFWIVLILLALLLYGLLR